MQAFTPQILCPLSSREFWVSFKDNIIQVGKLNVNANENLPFLTWTIPPEEKHLAKFTHFAFTTGWGACGGWVFYDHGNHTKKKFLNHSMLFFHFLCNNFVSCKVLRDFRFSCFKKSLEYVNNSIYSGMAFGIEIDLELHEIWSSFKYTVSNEFQQQSMEALQRCTQTSFS